MRTKNVGKSVARQPKISMRQAEKIIWQAYCEIERHLERRALLSVKRLAKRYRRVEFVSAWGAWFWYVTPARGGKRELKPPQDALFQRMRRQFGWDVIPHPLSIVAENGRITILRQW